MGKYSRCSILSTFCCKCIRICLKSRFIFIQFGFNIEKKKEKPTGKGGKKKGDINRPGTHALARSTTKNAGGEVRGTTEHDTKNGIQKNLQKKHKHDENAMRPIEHTPTHSPAQNAAAECRRTADMQSL